MGVHGWEATNVGIGATGGAFKAKSIAVNGAPTCSAALSRQRHQKSNTAGTKSVICI